MSEMAYNSGYRQALKDLEEKLDNAVENGGGIDAGNGVFIPNAHWDFEIRDQIIQLKGEQSD